MTTIISKTQYNKLLEEHKKIKEKVHALEEFVVANAQDELKPDVKKRLEKISKAIDRGEGKRFKSISSFGSYLRNL